MPNQSYCRRRNTYQDLQDCEEFLENMWWMFVTELFVLDFKDEIAVQDFCDKRDDISIEEAKACKRTLKLCQLMCRDVPEDR